MSILRIAMLLAGFQLLACGEAPVTPQAADSALPVAPAIVVDRPPEPGKPVPILNQIRKAGKSGGGIG